MHKLNKREERMVNAMHALGDKTRYKMFKILASNKEMCVSEIAEAVKISVPAASQHFRIFELNGLVDKKRDGQKICYNLKSEDSFVKELLSVVFKK
jgi:ArsR family transcriptional regulator